METLNKRNGQPDTKYMPPKLTLNYSDMNPTEKDDVNYMYIWDESDSIPDDECGVLHINPEEYPCAPNIPSQLNFPTTASQELS